MRRSGVAGGIPRWEVAPYFLLWLVACWGLSTHWLMNPQYQYGWFVPGFALFAAFKRWQARPAPGVPAPIGLWIAGIGCLLLAPSWLFLQPNPDWPLFRWCFVAQIVAILLGAIAAVGGWRWARHFLFPVGLIFTAVPWPDQIESPVMQTLMRSVAAIAVAGLDLIGVPALQHGNLLEVAGGVVGVNEACSGIRSLQGALMAAVFLGEMFRFNVARRVLLIAVSIVVAFATNVLRVAFLAWSAASRGVAIVDRWHDPAGMTILAICVAAILLVALALDRPTLAAVGAAVVPPAQRMPRWFTPLVAGWLGLTVAGAELWYYDPAPIPSGPWAARVPAGCKSMAVSPTARAQLRYDEATAVSWDGAGGEKWLMYFFDWKFGPAFARVAAQMHSPDICLPATGRELHQNRGKLTFAIDGTPLVFHGYVFRQGEDLQFVYHGVWPFRSQRGLSHGPLSPWKHAASVESVLWRERSIGQQSAEFVVSGFADPADADAAFARLLPEVIVPRQAAGNRRVIGSREGH